MQKKINFRKKNKKMLQIRKYFGLEKANENVYIRFQSQNLAIQIKLLKREMIIMLFII